MKIKGYRKSNNCFVKLNVVTPPELLLLSNGSITVLNTEFPVTSKLPDTLPVDKEPPMLSVLAAAPKFIVVAVVLSKSTDVVPAIIEDAVIAVADMFNDVRIFPVVLKVNVEEAPGTPELLN